MSPILTALITILISSGVLTLLLQRCGRRSHEIPATAGREAATTNNLIRRFLSFLASAFTMMTDQLTRATSTASEHPDLPVSNELQELRSCLQELNPEDKSSLTLEKSRQIWSSVHETLISASRKVDRWLPLQLLWTHHIGNAFKNIFADRTPFCP